MSQTALQRRDFPVPTRGPRAGSDPSRPGHCGRRTVRSLIRSERLPRYLSYAINLKNKSAGDGCRDKTIEKTILRTFRARTFSRSQGHFQTSGRVRVRSVHPSTADMG